MVIIISKILNKTEHTKHTSFYRIKPQFGKQRRSTFFNFIMISARHLRHHTACLHQILEHFVKLGVGNLHQTCTQEHLMDGIYTPGYSTDQDHAFLTSLVVLCSRHCRHNALYNYNAHSRAGQKAELAGLSWRGVLKTYLCGGATENCIFSHRTCMFLYYSD